jgi:uncharacterized protein (DUF433 family)
LFLSRKIELSHELTFPPELVPLRIDEGGVVRVGNSRVNLDLIIQQYSSGMNPEVIVRDYDSLALADVYSTIAYFMRHSHVVQVYL